MSFNQLYCPSCQTAMAAPQDAGQVGPVQCPACGQYFRVRPDEPILAQPSRAEGGTRLGLVVGISVAVGLLLIGVAVGVSLWLASRFAAADAVPPQAGRQSPNHPQTEVDSVRARDSTAAPANQSESGAEEAAQDELQRIQEESRQRLESKARAVETARANREAAKANREAAEKKRAAIPLVQGLDKLDLEPSE